VWARDRRDPCPVWDSPYCLSCSTTAVIETVFHTISSSANAGSARSFSAACANMCVESHLRALLEQGVEVAVAKDARAAPINYTFLAHAVWTTDETVRAIARGQPLGET
jgi:hypothetical protein